MSPRNSAPDPGQTYPGSRRMALGIEYDGSDFHGWQTQRTGVRTVQQVLQVALSKIAAQPIAVQCAGRTDAGVHASGQVVHFDCIAQRPISAWTQGVNSQLPDDVSVQWAQPVVSSFHARFAATARRYRYRICNRPLRSALARRTASWIYSPLDAQRMQSGAQSLLGEHDFSAYRAAACQSRTPWRCIDEITVQRHGDWITIDVEANAFLHHMVRNIVGVLIAVGKGEESIDWPAEVLASRDRRVAGNTAPATGLSLIAVRYPASFAVPRSQLVF